MVAAVALTLDEWADQISDWLTDEAGDEPLRRVSPFFLDPRILVRIHDDLAWAAKSGGAVAPLRR